MSLWRQMRQVSLGHQISNSNSRTQRLIITEISSGCHTSMVSFFLSQFLNLSFLNSLEHFIVWMRTAGLPNFRKLWGKIEENKITPGDYELTIQGNYDVKKFDGKKSFVITNQNAIGGKQPFLALCYILLAILCLLAAVFFKFAEIKKGPQRQ